MQLKRTMKVIMTHDYWICGTLISTEFNIIVKKIPNHFWNCLWLFVYMHEKQILMQEWICMKCPHTSSVEGDQYFNSRSTCMSLLRHGCQRHSFLNSQTASQMYTFPDQMNWQFVQILMDSKLQSKLRVLDTDDVKQKTSLFSFQGKSAWYVFMVFCSFVLYVICVCYTK